MFFRFAATVMVGVAIFGLAACGGGDGDDGGVSVPTELPNDTQIQLVKITDLDTLADGIDFRYVSVSPDGSVIGWAAGRSNGLCLYTFASEETVCSPFPEDLRSAISMAWSPDSRYVAFTEHIYQFMDESDIWIFSVEDHTYTNRTDDGVFRNDFMQDNSRVDAWLDASPTWSPNGDLYFFRSTWQGDGYASAVLRIPAEELLSTDRPDTVVDFTQHVGEALSVFTGGQDALPPAAVSPDGERLAVLLRPHERDNPAHGVWLVDLDDGVMEQIVTRADVLARVTPEWLRDEVEALDLFGLAWIGRGEGLIVAASQTYDPPEYANAFFYDLQAGTLTPLEDFSDVGSMADFFAVDAANRFMRIDDAPTYLGISPNRTALFYTRMSGSPPRIRIVPLPPAAEVGAPMHFVTVGEDHRPRPMTRQASVGSDDGIVRLIMLGMLFTFERTGGE